MVDMLTWPKTQTQVTLLPGGVLFVVYYYSHIPLLWDAIAVHHGFSFVHESMSFFFMQASIYESVSFFFMQASLYVHALVSCNILPVPGDTLYMFMPSLCLFSLYCLVTGSCDNVLFLVHFVTSY